MQLGRGFDRGASGGLGLDSGQAKPECGKGVVMPARADSIAAALFRMADGQLRAAEIMERPDLPKAAAAAILAAVAPHLKGKANA